MEDINMDEKTLEIKKTGAEEVILIETRTYAQTKGELEVRLHNINYDKENLIQRSKEIKQSYDRLIEEENKIKAALQDMQPKEIDDLETL